MCLLMHYLQCVHALPLYTLVDLGQHIHAPSKAEKQLLQHQQCTAVSLPAVPHLIHPGQQRQHLRVRLVLPLPPVPAIIQAHGPVLGKQPALGLPAGQRVAGPQQLSTQLSKGPCPQVRVLEAPLHTRGGVLWAWCTCELWWGVYCRSELSAAAAVRQMYCMR